MKKQIILSLTFLFLSVSCKDGDFLVFGKSVTVEPVTATKECYEYDQDGNDISMQIETTGKDVIGAMTYSLSEKDKNAGILKGQWKNDILLLDYTFLSEGTESTRQVAFQLKDGQLIEGYGEMTEDGTKFKEVSQLKFTSTMPLSKTNCPK